MISYDTYQKGLFQVIRIVPALDMNSDISGLEKKVTELLERKCNKIAVYFPEDSYISSSAGAVIVRCWETIKDRKGDMVLINVNKNIYDFLSIIGFTSVNKIFNSDDELESLE